MKGTMTSVADPERQDAMHHNYVLLKGDLETMRFHIAKAENDHNMMQHEVAKATIFPVCLL
jgi:hypothetical protein